MCTIPLLNRVCRESYTEPGELYETLKARGMDLVTVTDHDSIDAAEALKRRPDFFTSVEVSCTLPSGNQLHAGIYDITERQHIETQRRRNDLPSLVAYLREQGLFYTVNHAFSPLTGSRAVEDWRLIEQAFPGAETRNGTMSRRSNRKARAWAEEWGLAPVGGSDAHTLRGAGRTFTEVPGVASREGYLAGIRRGAGRVRGESGSWVKLTCDVFSIALSMFSGDPRTTPLAVLCAIIPLATAVSTAREHLFAARWASRARAAVPLAACESPDSGAAI
jgi:predicted metal-dependent phosphoesterase TrpH